MLFQSIVRVNTDVVTRRGVLKWFKEEKSVKTHKLSQCLWTVVRTGSYSASQRKSHARLLLFSLECNVEQLLHKFLMFSPPTPRLLFEWIGPPGEALCALADF